MEDTPSSVLLIATDPELYVRVPAAMEGKLAFFGAKSVALGLKIADRRVPAVVIIEVDVAGVDPEEVVEALRERNPAIRAVLVTSGQAPRGPRLTSIGTVLTKPVDRDRLAQAIHNALRFQGMSEGVEKLRSSTGQFRRVPELATTRRTLPPPSSKPRPEGT